MFLEEKLIHDHPMFANAKIITPPDPLETVPENLYVILTIGNQLSVVVATILLMTGCKILLSEHQKILLIVDMSACCRRFMISDMV